VRNHKSKQIQWRLNAVLLTPVRLGSTLVDWPCAAARPNVIDRNPA